jgi:hypothetical protein
MSECDFDAEPEGHEEPGVDVVPTSPAATPGVARAATGATPSPESDLAAVIARARSAAASKPVSELSASDRWKLDTVHVGARNDPIMVHPLWDRTGAETTRTDGNSTPYIGTQSLLEIGCGLLVEGSFCDHGWILLQFVGTLFTRFASAAMQVEFTLETADLPNPDDPDPEVAGTWPAFTTHKTWGSKAITATPAGIEFMFVVAIHARGHKNGVWNQTCNGEMKWDNPSASPEDAGRQDFLRALTTTIDPTVHKTIRSRFRITNQISIGKVALNWTESTLTLAQSGAWTGYTPVAGDRITITFGPSPVVPGTYTIAGKTSDDELVLTSSITGASPGDVGGNAIACTIQVNFFNVTASRGHQFGPAVGSLN